MNVTIIGTGLIGGSMASHFERAGHSQQSDRCEARRDASLQKALELGIDRRGRHLEEAVEKADLVIVADSGTYGE